MSRSAIEALRNPQPYPAPSDSSNPPSRSRTPTSILELTNPKPYPKPTTPTAARPTTPGSDAPSRPRTPTSLAPSSRPRTPASNAPSRPRTPASILELTNPKPYPKATTRNDDVPLVKPTPQRPSPAKPAKTYQQRDADKPRGKRLTKTKNTPRPSSRSTTPVNSDTEITSFKSPSVNAAFDGPPSRSSTPREETKEPIDSKPHPAPRTTSLDGKATARKEKEKEAGVDAVAVTITPSRRAPLTAKEKREKQLKAAGDEEEVWYKRHEKILWIVCFLVCVIVVFSFALGLGLSLGSARGTMSAGSFAKTQNCRFQCQNRPSYTTGVRPPLILIAMDGLPTNAVNEDMPTKNMQRLAACGVHSHNIIPPFASTTYPSLWTMLTGLYPERHGIYSDYMTDGSQVFQPREVMDASGGNLKNPQWYKAKPLWQTAREQGVVTASHSWLGNNVDDVTNHAGQTINSKPNYFQPYNAETTNMERMETVINWISQDDVNKVPEFITVFFEDPGKAIRQYGMNSQQANDSLLEVDDAIGHLLDTLMARNDVGCFNVMILSTSGLVATNCGNNNEYITFLQNEVPNNNLNGFTVTPDYLNSFARINVASSADENVNTNRELTDFLKCKMTQNGSVYTRDEIPSRLHYSSQAIPDDVFVLMKDGRSFARTSSNYVCCPSSDGYEPTGQSMRGLFVGFGPDFRIAYGLGDYYQLDFYNIIAKIIGVTQESNNGTYGILNKMLQRPGTFPHSNPEIATQSECKYSSDRTLGMYDTGCSCPDSGTQTATLFDTPLDMADNVEALHTPFGSPSILAESNPIADSTCPLYQSSYYMTFDKALTIPKYVSFTLKTGFSSETQTASCTYTDTRLMVGENPKCTTYTDPEEAAKLPDNMKQSYLLQPALAINNREAGIISSNIVPQYEEFQSAIWSQLVNRYRTWANLPSTNGINVVQGPVYDINHDGLADDFTIATSSSDWAGATVIPSHYFVVVTRCTGGILVENCSVNNIQVLAFILPHNNMGIPCQSTSFDDYIRDHLATVRDVEQITGLSFFSTWQMSDAQETRMQITEIKVRAPGSIWTS